jgi:F-type H+-transporting ATPase subunit a
MILLFFRLARTYSKRWIATGGGRIFEPVVLFIRDEIDSKHRRKALQEIHELFVDYLSLCYS